VIIIVLWRLVHCNSRFTYHVFGVTSPWTKYWGRILVEVIYWVSAPGRICKRLREEGRQDRSWLKLETASSSSHRKPWNTSGLGKKDGHHT
jgi:hypothetical protein